jgi:hypothetical protein
MDKEGRGVGGSETPRIRVTELMERPLNWRLKASIDFCIFPKLSQL